MAVALDQRLALVPAHAAAPVAADGYRVGGVGRLRGDAVGKLLCVAVDQAA